jgi:hypothetical protein
MGAFLAAPQSHHLQLRLHSMVVTSFDNPGTVVHDVAAPVLYYTLLAPAKSCAAFCRVPDPSCNRPQKGQLPWLPRHVMHSGRALCRLQVLCSCLQLRCRAPAGLQAPVLYVSCNHFTSPHCDRHEAMHSLCKNTMVITQFGLVLMTYVSRRTSRARGAQNFSDPRSPAKSSK